MGAKSKARAAAGPDQRDAQRRAARAAQRKAADARRRAASSPGKPNPLLIEIQQAPANAQRFLRAQRFLEEVSRATEGYQATGCAADERLIEIVSDVGVIGKAMCGLIEDDFDLRRADDGLLRAMSVAPLLALGNQRERRQARQC